MALTRDLSTIINMTPKRDLPFARNYVYNNRSVNSNETARDL